MDCWLCSTLAKLSVSVETASLYKLLHQTLLMPAIQPSADLPAGAGARPLLFCQGKGRRFLLPIALGCLDADLDYLDNTSASVHIPLPLHSRSPLFQSFQAVPIAFLSTGSTGVCH